MAYRIIFLTVMPSPYQRQLFQALVRSGSFDLRIVYYAATANDRLWVANQLEPFEAVLPGTTLRSLGNSAHLNPSIVRFLGRTTSDLVVVSDYSAPTAQLAMRYLSACKRPWVFWGELPGIHGRGALGRFVRNRLQAPIRRASGIAAIGSRAVEAYKALFPAVPIFNIPYFCDLTSFETTAAELRRERNEKTIDVLFSGQLIARKGVDIVISAFAESADACPNMRLLLLGDGPERGRFAAMVPPELHERVLFLGHREPEELPQIFAAAHIFVLPSRHDGWGVVVNEALGAGLPVIASDRVGAAHDLVSDGVNGFITPAGDAAALAKAMVTLGRSHSLRLAFSNSSRERARDWSLDKAVERWQFLCETLLGDRAAA